MSVALDGTLRVEVNFLGFKFRARCSERRGMDRSTEDLPAVPLPAPATDTADGAGPRRVARHGHDTLTELNVVREAGERLPSSLHLRTVLSAFIVALLLSVTLPVLFVARTADEEFRYRVLVIAACTGVGAAAASLLFVRFYFGPVLRFAENTLQKLQNLTATLEQRVEERTAALVESNGRLRRTLEQNRNIQRQLMDASRRAGMAEVATSVLHNVGNVLNSVNVSAGVVIDTVQRSRVSGLGKAAELIREHESDWARFLSEDDKGRKLPAYICSLAEAAAQERIDMLAELSSLQGNIDHIKSIVSRQQSQVKATLGVLEDVNVADVVEEALRSMASGLERKRIRVERQHDDLPRVRLDRHKLYEMVMNLLSNARHALVARAFDKGGDRVLTVRTSKRGESGAGARFEVEVSDNGCGIAPDNLARIFTFGFTTRTGGHGFGLHSSALAAAEMGGSLRAESPGLDQGARFIISLPFQPPPGYAATVELQEKTPPPELH